MGFLAPAMPWILKGGAALGASLLGRKAQSNAQQRSPEEQQALAGAQSAATGMTGAGMSAMQTGQQQSGQAAGYWSTLLGGNRAAMSQATAAPRASITDTYRGAERGLERSNVRGAQRDVAKAELNRDRAGKIAGLTTGVQPMAAEALGGLGSDTSRTGAYLAGQGGDLFSNLLGQGAANRQYARQEGQGFGSSIGSLLFDLIASGGKGGGGGGMKTLASRSLTNGMAGGAPRLY